MMRTKSIKYFHKITFQVVSLGHFKGEEKGVLDLLKVLQDIAKYPSAIVLIKDFLIQD